MTSTVGKVRVRLRVPERDAARADALRIAVEQQLLRGVLDALEAAVHARLGPDAIVRVRRLPVRWKLGGAELADRAVHAQLGAELAEGLVAAASPALPPSGASAAERAQARRARPAPGASIVAFVDEPHALAVALAERGEGADAAFHHPAQTVAELWQLVAAGGAARVALVAELLRAYGAAPALAAAPAAVLALAAAPRTAAPRAAPAPRVALDEPGVTTSPLTTEAAAPAPAPLATAEALAASPLAVPTRLGGAFCFLGVALELDLAEHLWCAGLPEGPHLAQALAQLAPAALADDPALVCIAGASPHLPAPAPAWALDEVAAKARDSLGRWLATRGVALTPDEVAARLAALAAELPDPLAAALCAVACERLGAPWAAAPARALVLRTGAIREAPDAVLVELPLDSVDLDVRRAGLDFDPGWIPWLAKTVRFAYV